MKLAFKLYYTHICDNFSPLVCFLLTLGLIIAIVIGGYKGWKSAWKMLLIGFSIFIIYVTVLSRSVNEQNSYCFRPFQSYEIIAGGNPFLVPEVLMNILMYVPFGFLAKAAFNSLEWKVVLLLGFAMSLSVEVLQLSLMRGTAEIDDVIHNTIGCCTGIVVCSVIVKLKNKYVQTFF